MALKPWYKVITPREDLRDGRPLDASEFAVHLDHVRDGRAPDDYKKPERFFERSRHKTSWRRLLRRAGPSVVHAHAPLASYSHNRDTFPIPASPCRRISDFGF